MTIHEKPAGLRARPMEAELEETLRRYPGVARARVLRDADGQLVAHVLPWGTHSVTADPGILAELAGSAVRPLSSPSARGESRSRSARGELPSPESSCRRTWPHGCAPSPAPMRSP
jgi:hypothetical protein